MVNELLRQTYAAMVDIMDEAVGMSPRRLWNSNPKTLKTSFKINNSPGPHFSSQIMSKNSPNICETLSITVLCRCDSIFFIII